MFVHKLKYLNTCVNISFFFEEGVHVLVSTQKGMVDFSLKIFDIKITFVIDFRWPTKRNARCIIQNFHQRKKELKN